MYIMVSTLYYILKILLHDSSMAVGGGTTEPLQHDF